MPAVETERQGGIDARQAHAAQGAAEVRPHVLWPLSHLYTPPQIGMLPMLMLPLPSCWTASWLSIVRSRAKEPLVFFLNSSCPHFSQHRAGWGPLKHTRPECPRECILGRQSDQPQAAISPQAGVPRLHVRQSLSHLQLH